MNSLLRCSNTFTPSRFKKISKTLFFSIALLFLTQMLFAQQTGTIKGTVKTFDGKPAEFAIISLNGTSKSSIVNPQEATSYIASGTYTLTAKFSGLLS